MGPCSKSAPGPRLTWPVAFQICAANQNDQSSSLAKVNQSREQRRPLLSKKAFCLHAVTGLRAETEGRRVIGFPLPPAINSIPRGRHAFPSALWDGHAGARQAGQTTGSAARSTLEQSVLKISYPEERLRSVERLSTTPFTDCRLPFPGSNWHRYCANNQLVWDEWEQLILNG